MAASSCWPRLFLSLARHWTLSEQEKAAKSVISSSLANVNTLIKGTTAAKEAKKKNKKNKQQIYVMSIRLLKQSKVLRPI